jgi:MFS family permease
MSIVSLIYTIFPSIGGLIYVYLDYSSTFLIASIIFLPALFPLALYEDVEIKKEGVRFDLKRILLPKKTELSVLIPFVLERISWGLWIFILNAIPNDLYGLGPEYLGLALSIQNSSWFISQYIFGRITDKVKPKYIYMFSNFVGIPMILLMLFVKDTRILLLTWALFGVSIASWIPSFNKLVFKITDIETRATTYGRIDSLRNLLGFPTPYIGGLMYVNIGLYAPLYTGMGLIAILMAIAYKLLPD